MFETLKFSVLGACKPHYLLAAMLGGANFLVVFLPGPSCTSEVGGRKCEPAPPKNREIVSIRSCVSARGACFGTKNLPLVASILYLSAWDIVSYLLEICLPLDEMNVKVKSK